MKEILIFGHQNPDTDSVTSAIALANLKKQLNIPASPWVLGNINNETKFVLDYLKVKKPKFLNDVKQQIKDVNYLKDVTIDENNSILNVLKCMEKNNINTIPITETKTKRLAGIINLNNVLQFLTGNNFRNIQTSYTNLINALEATKVTHFGDEIKGNLLVAAYESQTFIKEITLSSDSILIVGDRPDIQEHAINNNIQLLIIANNFNIPEHILKLAQKNKVNIIKTAFDSYTIAHLALFSNYAHQLSNNENFVAFHENDYVSEFKRIAQDSKQLHFPVLSNENTVKGIIALDNLNHVNRKQVILVDHNEANQSVEGLDEAEILEIIDHHKIGNMTTAYPINFRNMIVGSTCSIIYHLYQENNVKFDPATAVLLMAGIISDTLLLQSPTTTNLDKKVLEELNKIVDVDYQDLAQKMFEAGSSTKNMSKEEIIYSDFKTFTVRNQLIGLGQFKTTNPDDIKKDLALFKEKIEAEAANKNYYIFALFVTDIINNGSYVIYNDSAADIIKKAFALEKIHDWVFISDKISRKQQMIPRIINIIEKTH